MTPIHPDHRQEAIAELEDLARMLRTSEVITYEDLDQRLDQLCRMVATWLPDDQQRQLSLECLGPAQVAIARHILGYDHENSHPDQLLRNLGEQPQL